MIQTDRDFQSYLFDDFPNPVWQSRINGGCDYFNKAWLEFTGRSLSQELGDGWAQGVQAEDLERCLSTYRNAFERREPFAMEYRLRHHDGSYHWLLDHGRPVYSPDGQFTGYIGSCYDITDRKQAEDLLRANKEKYRSLIENLSDIVYTSDLEGRLTYISPVLERWTQYKVSDLLGRSFIDFLHPEDVPGMIEAFRKTFAEEPKPYEARWIDKDGRILYVRTNGRPLIENGRLVGTIGSATHITEQKQAEMALRATEQSLRVSEQRFRSIFDKAAIGIALVDERNRIVMANPALHRTLGYAAGELCGMAIKQISDPEDMKLDRLLKDDILAGRRDSYQLEKHYLHRGGQIVWGRLTVSILHDGGAGGTLTLGMVEDITQQKATQEALRVSQEHLRQAQKMEAIALLAGGIAHDFRNQLTIIKGYTEMLLRRSLVGPESRGYLEEVINAANRSSMLTGDLLSFSRRQDMRPETVDLNRTLSDMRKTLVSLVGEDVRLTIRPASEAACVRIDPVQFQQAIVNMVVNARHAMPDGGDLTIEVMAVHLDSEFVIRNVGAAPGPHVRVSICDTGTGVDESVRLRIFEPFFTTKPVGQGTGLGLPMVYGFVQQSGGHIHVQSEVGCGSTFHLYFPHMGQASSEVQTLAAPDALPPGKGTVLVVEDEIAIRRLLVHILEECGYTLLDAGHPTESLSLVETFDGRIDLLVTDVVMPDMNGVELARCVRAIYPDVRILY